MLKVKGIHGQGKTYIHREDIQGRWQKEGDPDSGLNHVTHCVPPL